MCKSLERERSKTGYGGKCKVKLQHSYLLTQFCFSIPHVTEARRTQKLKIKNEIKIKNSSVWCKNAEIYSFPLFTHRILLCFIRIDLTRTKNIIQSLHWNELFFPFDFFISIFCCENFHWEIPSKKVFIWCFSLSP